MASANAILTKDRHHARIVEALAGHLDADVFEECVCDLLRPVFPGLALVRGGSDGGFDGAIPEGASTPFPLIVTTSTDVERNLKKNLERARATGFPGDRVILATSQNVTPGLRAKLEASARERQFTLAQIFDRADLAQRLYREPAWCQALLNLSGKPGALSAFSGESRIPLGESLVGREDDLDWLRTMDEDRVLAGQPGSGKTCLASQLVADGRASFLISNDDQAIANDLRELKPKIVVIDDAHLAIQRIGLLRHLRREGPEFLILATTWPAERTGVAAELGAPTASRTRTLEPLRPDQIFEVYQRLGVAGPDGVMRVLVDQAAGKPGLAATLAHAWLTGDHLKTLTGEVLCDSILSSVRHSPNSAQQLLEVLGVLALGGHRGMPITVAARHLDASESDLRNRASHLLAGGVLEQVESGILRITPGDLRPPLIRRACFPGPHDNVIAFDPWPLVNQLDPKVSAATELVRALAIAPAVHRARLRELVEATIDAEVGASAPLLREFATLGPAEARWALSVATGELLQEVASATWHHAPDETADSLLERTPASTWNLHSQATHPLRVLRDVMLNLAAFEQDPDDAIDRRAKVIRAARRLRDQGGDATIALQAALMALSPVLEGVSQHPGHPNQFTLRRAMVSPSGLERIGSLWPLVKPLLGEIDRQVWGLLSSCLWDWIHPPISEADVEGAHTPGDSIARFLETAVSDLHRIAGPRPGLSRAMRELVGAAGDTLAWPEDPLFDLLFCPRPSHRDAPTPAAVSQRGSALQKLADEWSERGPAVIAPIIARYEIEAAFLAPGHERGTRAICRSISDRSTDPDAWCDALVAARTPADLVEPFLERSVALRTPGWHERLARYLNGRDLSIAATQQVLQLETAPTDLLDTAIARANSFPDLVETLASRHLIPGVTLSRLLDARDPLVSTAALIGEWRAARTQGIRTELIDQWKAALLRIDATGLQAIRQWSSLEFGLEEILERDGALAYLWLSPMLPTAGPYVRGEGPVTAALRALDDQQRISLLEAIPAGGLWGGFVSRLVSRKPTVFRELLKRPHLRPFALSPLEFVPDQDWWELARVAVDSGQDPEAIARAAFGGLQVSYEETRSQHFEPVRKAFAAASANPELSTELQRVAAIGVRLGAETVAVL